MLLITKNPSAHNPLTNPSQLSDPISPDFQVKLDPIKSWENKAAGNLSNGFERFFPIA
jgi:hypothetical protein